MLGNLEGGLIVSCQPVDGGPLDTVAAIVGYALAARNAGARALRIEGAEHVAAVSAACELPIIGIVKRDLNDSPVRITPFLEDVADLAAAGAAIIAVDGTDRARPVPVADLLAAIHSQGCLAMADLSNEAEAVEAHRLGFDILGTTLSGYTGGAVPAEPDLALVSACSQLGGTVVAEGRYNAPATAAAAIRAGASAVCVGSAITRPEYVTNWFLDAVNRAASQHSSPVLALDIGGTKTLAALVRDGQIIDYASIATPDGVATDAWFAALRGLASTWSGQFTCVGAAVTGVIEDGHWSALNPATLAIPERTPLVSRLSQMFGLPTVALNDAQAAAWGEYRHGAAGGLDMIFVTVSSGIGGGIVVDGKLMTGARGLAGSLGQVSGAFGASRLESRASGFAIAANAAAAGHPSDTRTIVAAATNGEPWADQILEAAARDLAVALADLQRIVDPNVVVIGGGIGMLPSFRARLHRLLEEADPRSRPNIATAALGANAGIIGIADYASLV